MARKNKMPSLFHQLLELQQALLMEATRTKIYAERHNGLMYSREEVGEGLSINTAVAILDTNLFRELSGVAIKYIVTQIIPEMRMNNIFWRHEIGNSKDRALYAELKRVQILLPTARPGLYLINPMKLRRGKPLTTVAASIQALANEESTMHLMDLRPPKSQLLLES
jgi:hypothetical protein